MALSWSQMRQTTTDREKLLARCNRFRFLPGCLSASSADYWRPYPQRCLSWPEQQWRRFPDVYYSRGANMFKGSIVAHVTPFTKQGEVDYPALKKLVFWHAVV